MSSKSNPGSIVSIHIAEEEGGILRSLKEAELTSGHGIVGDRNYFMQDKKPEQELTLIESEQVQYFNEQTGLRIDAAETRRNIVTCGIALNDLVGARFSIGDTKLEGIELCEPCKYVAECLTSRYSITMISISDIVSGLVHRAGLRARIVEGGTIRVGDIIGSGE